MVARGMIKKSHLPRFEGVVVLGGGDVSKKLNVSAHRFSRSAKEKLDAAGGTATLIAATVTAE